MNTIKNLFYFDAKNMKCLIISIAIKCMALLLGELGVMYVLQRTAKFKILYY